MTYLDTQNNEKYVHVVAGAKKAPHNYEVVVLRCITRPALNDKQFSVDFFNKLLRDKKIIKC